MTREQLERRRAGIGGSDAPAIIGVSPWRSPLDVYLDKIGEAEEVEESPAMRWGTALEPLVRQAYADATGETVRVPALLVHPRHPWMIGHLDGLTDSGRVLECKTARTAEGWGEPGTDEIPDAYLIQVQHYLTVTALSVADVAVLIGGSDFRLYEIPADGELQSALMDQEAAFWREHVEAGLAPDPRSLADVKRRWRISTERRTQASEDVRASVATLRLYKAQIAALEAKRDEEIAFVLASMGDADTLAWQEDVLATWKNSKPAKRFDGKAFQAAHADLYRDFLRAGAPARRFLLKGEST